MNAHVPTTIPETNLDQILDREYERRRRARDDEDRAARSAVERISERKQVRRPGRVG